VLSPDAVAGRKLFHTAVDSRMSASTNMSCAGCHPAGREDGHVWLFPDGPRQTPSLAGRQVTQTAPFHWTGEFSTLDAFLNTTVGQRMGGSGVTPAMGVQLAAFIDSMPTPDSPLRVPEDQLSPVQLHGKEVFAQAGCDSCHAGAAFTNNTFADVGTLVRTGPAPDDLTRMPDGLNTPSLLGLSRTAPYLHDGSAATLKDRLMMGKELDLHGTTSALSEQDVDALVQYLQTL
jgi:cytochrome c peroxidase